VGRKSHFHWGAYAAIALALVMALSGVLFLSDYSEKLAANKSEQVVSRQEAGLVPVPSQSESVSQQAEPELLPVAEPKPAEMEEAPAPIPVPEPEKTFYVVAGSFKHADKIETLSGSLTKKGFNVSVHENSSIGFTRVAIGGFSSKDEAIRFLKEKQGGFSEQLWVLAE
jgi:cell division protein FtsN